MEMDGDEGRVERARVMDYRDGASWFALSRGVDVCRGEGRPNQAGSEAGEHSLQVQVVIHARLGGNPRVTGLRPAQPLY